MLEDTYLNQKTLVSMFDTTRIPFSITTDAESAKPNRFRLVFGPAVVVPVTFSSITAHQKQNDIEVEWKVENELNIVLYEVEKSLDGIHFVFENSLTARGGNSTYTSLDIHAVSGDNFYRVKSKDANGQVKYSRVVKVRLGKGNPVISIYPNPVAAEWLNLSFNNIPEGIFEVKIFNSIGQLILTKRINHANGSSSETILFGRKIAAGTYQLEIRTTGSNSKETIQFVAGE